MIRNVVFDLGNVLISFRPEEFLKEKNYPGKHEDDHPCRCFWQQGVADAR
jgi:FMN phosphatase YigB (HAD superfamily)